jgi:hypothetical protein
VKKIKKFSNNREEIEKPAWSLDQAGKKSISRSRLAV